MTLKPGWQTSEGRLAALQALVAAVIAALTLFGVATPSWLKPDAPWIGGVALIAGALVTALYGHGRVTLKKVVAQLEAVAPKAVADLRTPPLPPLTTPGALTPAGPDSGYGLIEVAFALFVVVIAFVVLLTFVHH